MSILIKDWDVLISYVPTLRSLSTDAVSSWSWRSQDKFEPKEYKNYFEFTKFESAGSKWLKRQGQIQGKLYFLELMGFFTSFANSEIWILNFVMLRNPKDCKHLAVEFS